MTLDFHEYRALKEKLLADGFQEIHLHDVCGGQYFSIDDPDDATCDALVAHFEPLGMRVNFSKTRAEFTLEEVEGEGEAEVDEPEDGGGAR